MLFREALPFPEISFFYDRSLLHVANSLSRSAAADKFFVRTSFMMAEAAILKSRKSGKSGKWWKSSKKFFLDFRDFLDFPDLSP